MAPFQYEPLDLEIPTFRLIRLLEGEYDDPIHCEIFQAFLDNGFEYDALSYTWGGTAQSSEIWVNGCTMAVTRNLYDALFHLRQRDEDIILWVDAVCIDQKNDKEKGHQIRQMVRMYQEAVQVIVWLGPADPDKKLFMQKMKKMEQLSRGKACGSWSLTDPRWNDLWFYTQSCFGEMPEKDMKHLIDGFISLLEGDWFRRVWIIQEIVNARRAKIACGEISLSTTIFTVAAKILDVRVQDRTQAVLDVMPGPGRDTSWWQEKRDLLTLLSRFNYSEASNEKDKIFALLGLSTDACDFEFIKADYGKSFKEIIATTAAFLVGHRQSAISSIVYLDLDFHDLLSGSKEQLHELIFRRSFTSGNFDIMVEIMKRQSPSDALWECMRHFKEHQYNGTNGLIDFLSGQYIYLPGAYTTLSHFISKDYPLSVDFLFRGYTSYNPYYFHKQLEYRGLLTIRPDKQDGWTVADFRLRDSSFSSEIRSMLGGSLDRLRIESKSGDCDREDEWRNFSEVLDCALWPPLSFIALQGQRREVYLSGYWDGRKHVGYRSFREGLKELRCLSYLPPDRVS